MTAKKRVKRITEMHVPLDETTPLHIVPFYVFLFGFVCLFGGFCFLFPGVGTHSMAYGEACLCQSMSDFYPRPLNISLT